MTSRTDERIRALASQPLDAQTHKKEIDDLFESVIHQDFIAQRRVCVGFLKYHFNRIERELEAALAAHAEAAAAPGLRELIERHIPSIKMDATETWLVCSCGMQTYGTGRTWKEWWTEHMLAAAPACQPQDAREAAPAGHLYASQRNYVSGPSEPAPGCTCNGQAEDAYCDIHGAHMEGDK